MRIISGLFKNRELQCKKGLDVRPTSSRLREALFDICQAHVDGCRFLDLFAGSGAMGLEAISRGACHATFVDSDKEAVKGISGNIEKFDVKDKTRVLKGDVLDWIERLSQKKERFDIIYVDPPYGVNGYSLKVLHLLDKFPLLNEGGQLFLEDVASALSENEPLKHLKLKSARKAGRSVLHQYVLA